MRAPDRAVVVNTHDQRLIDNNVTEIVHVLADGRIVESGDASLALKLEEHGYAWIAQRQAPVEHRAGAA
jgi:Fe-S cluster assembly ATP-binding protein